MTHSASGSHSSARFLQHPAHLRPLGQSHSDLGRNSTHWGPYLRDYHGGISFCSQTATERGKLCPDLGCSSANLSVDHARLLHLNPAPPYLYFSSYFYDQDRPEIQKALQDVLYNSNSGDKTIGTRLSVLLNSALGVVNRDSGAFIDFDSMPQGGISLTEALSYLASDRAGSIRTLLQKEFVTAGDILLRQATRKAFNQAIARATGSLPSVPPLLRVFLPPGGSPLSTIIPPLEKVPAPFLVRG